jgi:transcriptional regulator with XRE-family HTH domain
MGQALAAARKAASLTQAGVGELMKRSQTWVSRIEDGTRQASPNELEELLKLYRPADDLCTQIEALRTPPPAGGGDGSRLDPKFLKFKELELAASEVRVLTSERMPMNLQAEQYLLLQYRLAGNSSSQADLLAEHRRRQRVFTRENAAPYHVILAESALYRMPGGRLNLVAEQAAYLLELVDRFPQLRLQVLRFDADLPFLDADLVILTFADQRERKVFVPFGTSVSSLKDSRASYWCRAQQAALDEDLTRKFIHNLAQNGFRLPGVTDQP